VTGPKVAGPDMASPGRTRTGPRVSVVIPAHHEGRQVIAVLARLLEAVRLPCEVLVVVDSEDDPTAAVVSEYGRSEPRLRLLVNATARPVERHPVRHRRRRRPGGGGHHGGRLRRSPPDR
jgi:cellulose synthase/poly-beta-1,6-N-acetylglucosamine synthase-like glycosyltransferase